MPQTKKAPVTARNLYQYNPEDGNFRWLIATHGRGGYRVPGDIAGGRKDGYVTLKIDGIQYRAHRVAWYLMTGDWLPANQDIDHINRDRSDNRWINLRLATRSENSHNKTRNYGGRSGVNGVHFSRQAQKWEARISVDRKLHILGQFDDFAAAVASRRAAERRFLGRNEIPDDLVPTEPVTEPVFRQRSGVTEEGKASRLKTLRQSRNNEGRYPGVSLNANRNKWVAMIRAAGRSVYLGTFPRYEDAVTARRAAEAQFHT